MIRFQKWVLCLGLFCFLGGLGPALGEEVGLLLLHRPDQTEEALTVKKFLQELGRHWQERYGRVKPPPYPLGYYSLADTKTVERVRQRFPDLKVDSGPTAALCLYEQQRPVEVLQIFEDFSEPAVLVRMISSARSVHLARLRLKARKL